ncbi:MAG: SDR family NAD(P)-dependent oxidoreductase, partial [Brachybacterium sp.]|nr:SDR family NAD(P)-dependent oxidoreductase [Brachybacterium sp.]
TALQFAEQGWHVIAIARSEDTLADLAREQPRIEPRPADLTSGDFEGLIPERVDALVHAAGISPSARTVEDATIEDWTQAFTLNVISGAELIRRALPALRTSRGTVVLVNSGAGIVPTPRNTVYGATKHALRALANGLRADEEERGVRVTSVFPGPTDTPMFTGDVPRDQLIEAASVARAIISAVTATDDVQLTEIQVRPRRELSW